MKVAVVFVLLFATVLCRPARKVSESDSDSSEEVVRRPAPPAIRRQQLVLSKSRPAPVQKVVAPAKAGSEETEDASDEAEEAPAAEAPVEVKAAVAPTADTGSVDSEDSDDHDDDEEESETEEEESDSDSESGESSTPPPATVTPTPGAVEPETTQDYIEPTIVTDPDAGRGDSLGGYPDDYKSIVYVEEKSYHKAPNPYKSYEIVGKKVAYDMTYGNEVEKSPKVYKEKAFQIHSDLVEEDTSTPEVETQALDASSGISQDQDVRARQASLPAEDESTSSGASTANEGESSSTPEEDEGTSSPSASAESEDEEEQSSEEATATPGAADSDSDEDDSVESDSDEEGAGPDKTTEVPAVVIAK